MIKLLSKNVGLLILGIIFLSVNLYSGEDAEAIIKKIQKKYDSIKDAVVTFTNEVQFGVTKREQSFNGKFVMKKGNKYRLESEQQTFITDGQTIWSVNQLNKQVFIDKYHDDPKSFSLDKILINIPDNYSASILGKEKLKEQELFVLKLIPKNSKSNIRWIKVWINEEDLLMKKIQVLEVSDNLNTYTINDLKVNQGIKDTEFHYEPPPGIEVIDLRQ